MSRHPHGPTFILGTLLVGALGLGSPALAAPPQDADPATTTGGEPTADAPAPIDPVVEALARRAERIEALLADQLEPSLSAEALFRLDLNDPAARAYLDRKATPDPPDSPKSLALARLSSAWDAFLALPAPDRKQRLADHRARREAAGFPTLAIEERKRQSELFSRRAEQLQRFLDGIFVEGLNLGALCEIDMGDPLVHLELAAIARGEEQVTALPANLAERKWLAARLQLRTLQRRVVALDADARFALQQRQRQQDPTPSPIQAAEAAEGAEAAEAARLAAIEAAQRAESEEQRRRENARAALLGVQTDLGRVEARWAESDREQATVDEKLTALAERVERVETMGPLDGDPQAAADELYDPLRQQLVARTSAFEALLAARESGQSELPALRALIDEHGTAIENDEELQALSESLREQLAGMRERETERAWPALETKKQQLDLANQLLGRLRPLLSSELRAHHQGFHDSAVTEARREATFVEGNLRYWRLSVPRRWRGIRAEIQSNPIASAKGVGKVLLAFIAFVWWYTRREQTWEAIINWSRDPESGPLGRVVRSFAWSLPAVGGPLSWLALAWFLFAQLAVQAQIPGARMAWTIVAWVLVGRAVIRLLHAVAGRAPGGRKGDPTAALRLRSLRLVGLTIVLTALLLSTTAQSVGRGTIYGWVISTCWFLAIPLLLLLTAWWRPVIDRRLADLQQPSAVATWAGKPRRGPFAFVAALVGGIYLFIYGIRRYALRRAAEFESTRRILAYLVRREVARQAAERDESQYEAIPVDAYEALGPHAPQTHERPVIEVAPEVFSRTVHFARLPATSITAIVAEAGGGKTHFLDRVCDEVKEEMTCIRLAARHGGWEELRHQLAEALGLAKDAEPRELRRILSESMHLVAIDDAHRLVRPTIGGLAELDKLLSFARSIPETISWLLVIEDPAFAYVRRGRGEGALFDYVAQLPRWNETQIGELLRARSAEAQLQPDFAELEVPRQATDDDELEEEERCELGYYRILWDYVDGNPSLALHWWRESLVSDGDERVVVRLFQPPHFTELESLPDSLYFALRAIVQLDGAQPADIRAASQLPGAEVENALRYLMARDFVELREGRVFMTLHWYRAVTRVLWRRHLIIRSAA